MIQSNLVQPGKSCKTMKLRKKRTKLSLVNLSKDQRNVTDPLILAPERKKSNENWVKLVKKPKVTWTERFTWALFRCGSWWLRCSGRQRHPASATVAPPSDAQKPAASAQQSPWRRQSASQWHGVDKNL